MMRARFFVTMLFVLAFFGILGGSYANVTEDSNVFITPLQGNFTEMFLYWLDIKVGTPPKLFTVAFDTGSSDTLVPRVGCENCIQGTDPWYDPSASSTGSEILCSDPSYKCNAGCVNQTLCTEMVDYGGSVQEYAVLTTDEIVLPAQPLFTNALTRLAPMHKPHAPAVFGAIYNVTFPSAALGARRQRWLRAARAGDVSYPDGMLGMAFRQLSSSYSPPLLDALFEHGQLASPVFSVCLSEMGGAVAWGGVGPFSAAQPQYTAIVKPRFYAVQMTDFTVDGVSVGVDPSVYTRVGCIVDTGTPVPTLPAAAFAALRRMLLDGCATRPLQGVCRGVTAANETLLDGQCYTLTDTDVALFPTLQFVLAGVTLSYTPAAYLRPMYYCGQSDVATGGGRLVGLALAADDDFTVLGATLLQQYHTVYDKAEMRVGFAPVSQCKA